jgi:hypothetical protein
MLIANPIYDAVFKYLLEDNKTAKLLLGAIIGEKIEKLDFRPQEYITTLDKKKTKSKKAKNLSHDLTVYRLDFSAKIRQADGAIRLAIIELQKAKFPTDIMRFRRYLGGQYALKENTYRVRVPDKKDPTRYKLIQKAIPIVPIYFLGHRLNLGEGHPVIKIERQYIDNTTGEPIAGKDDFIEGLTHDSYVIQIQDLPKHRRNELEKLLSIFDQSNQTQDFHILNIDKADFAEKYHPIIRRLQQAIVEPDVRNMMTAEDDILEELEYKDREIAEARYEIDEKKQEIAEKEQVIIEKEQVIVEKERVIVEKEQALAEQQQIIKEQLRLIEQLKQQLPPK